MWHGGNADAFADRVAAGEVGEWDAQGGGDTVEFGDSEPRPGAQLDSGQGGLGQGGQLGQVPLGEAGPLAFAADAFPDGVDVHGSLESRIPS
ncbi:hypothetical protein Acor_13480 [Acrocarpospora corrugata]|uniref:Uncharacterized protein n=1 Tax=Acrocarpospora corrugata TaxID=35763 RepID=A0A5M3VR70_9ACTN|nr:hypothetical protein Acor_13480 [Acrocarpospora corrugata]